MSVVILRRVGEAMAYVRAARSGSSKLGLVPTMGFLHEGHLSLMRESRRRMDQTVVSIFVNPLQFGPSEDLARYPRDFEGDVSKCAQVGVDAVFAPEAADFYPEGFQTFVEVGQVSQGLCGARRPGHFRGVATVVTKLLALFRPDGAFFGEKDFQQLQLIRRLNRDLNFGVEVVGMPTVREPDGLAMSSRNKYLNSEERQRALALYAGLRAAREEARRGTDESGLLCGCVRGELRRRDVREDYVELVDAETLAPMARLARHRPSRLLVAAFVGTTRLIDNVAIGD